MVRVPKICGPFSATTGVMRQKTPMGLRAMIISMIFMQTSLTLSTKLAKGWAFSPTRIMAKPKNREATMTCSIEASAKGLMILLGKIFTIVSMMVGASLAS